LMAEPLKTYSDRHLQSTGPVEAPGPRELGQSCTRGPGAKSMTVDRMVITRVQIYDQIDLS
jgi:hypothetical protein